MLEKVIEAHLVKLVKKVGGHAYKFTSPAQRGVPDRICVFASGRVVFVELKAPGKKPTDLQLHEHNRLRKLGQRVEVIDSIDRVEEFINASA